jgi:hypothetical protein
MASYPTFSRSKDSLDTNTPFSLTYPLSTSQKNTYSTGNTFVLKLFKRTEFKQNLGNVIYTGQVLEFLNLQYGTPGTYTLQLYNSTLERVVEDFTVTFIDYGIATFSTPKDNIQSTTPFSLTYVLSNSQKNTYSIGDQFHVSASLLSDPTFKRNLGSVTYTYTGQVLEFSNLIFNTYNTGTYILTIINYPSGKLVEDFTVTLLNYGTATFSRPKDDLNPILPFSLTYVLSNSQKNSYSRGNQYVLKLFKGTDLKQNLGSVTYAGQVLEFLNLQYGTPGTYTLQLYNSILERVVEDFIVTFIDYGIATFSTPKDNIETNTPFSLTYVLSNSQKNTYSTGNEFLLKLFKETEFKKNLGSVTYTGQVLEFSNLQYVTAGTYTLQLYNTTLDSLVEAFTVTFLTYAIATFSTPRYYLDTNSPFTFTYALSSSQKNTYSTGNEFLLKLFNGPELKPTIGSVIYTGEVLEFSNIQYSTPGTYYLQLYNNTLDILVEEFVVLFQYRGVFSPSKDNLVANEKFTFTYRLSQSQLSIPNISSRIFQLWLDDTTLMGMDFPNQAYNRINDSNFQIGYSSTLVFPNLKVPSIGEHTIRIIYYNEYGTKYLSDRIYAKFNLSQNSNATFSRPKDDLDTNSPFTFTYALSNSQKNTYSTGNAFLLKLFKGTEFKQNLGSVTYTGEVLEFSNIQYSTPGTYTLQLYNTTLDSLVEAFTVTFTYQGVFSPSRDNLIANESFSFTYILSQSQLSIPNISSRNFHLWLDGQQYMGMNVTNQAYTSSINWNNFQIGYSSTLVFPNLKVPSSGEHTIQIRYWNGYDNAVLGFSINPVFKLPANPIAIFSTPRNELVMNKPFNITYSVSQSQKNTFLSIPNNVFTVSIDNAVLITNISYSDKLFFNNLVYRDIQNNVYVVGGEKTLNMYYGNELIESFTLKIYDPPVNSVSGFSTPKKYLIKNRNFVFTYTLSKQDTTFFMSNTGKALYLKIFNTNDTLISYLGIDGTNETSYGDNLSNLLQINIDDHMHIPFEFTNLTFNLSGDYIVKLLYYNMNTYRDNVLDEYNVTFYNTVDDAWAAANAVVNSPSSSDEDIRQANTFMQNNLCFNKGTKILTLHQESDVYRPIETLKKGDLVKSYKHGYRKIDMIGKGQLISQPGIVSSSMYVMKKTDTNFLLEDLIVTGWHSIMVDEEKDSNGTIDDKYLVYSYLSKEFTQIESTEEFTYYHFILENDGDEDRRFGVWANGALMETPSKKQFLAQHHLDFL